jgi:hypothetical protein
MENRQVVLAIMGCYLMGLGVLSGMLIEDIRYDKSRSALLAQLQKENDTLHERLMEIEREAAEQPAGTP